MGAGLGRPCNPLATGLTSEGGGDVFTEENGGKVVVAANPGGAAVLDGIGSERKTEGKAMRLKANFLKSAAGGVVSNKQIF